MSISGRLLGSQHGPADVEVRRVEIQPDADENPGGELLFGAQARIVHGAFGDREHQRLLGQHVLELQRRDPEPVQGQ